jgi:type 1 fimbria pilin
MQRCTALLTSAASLLWASGCSSLGGGDVSLVIDGKKQNVRGSVSCSAHAGGDVVSVGDLPAGIFAHLAPGGSSVVELDLGNSTGKSLVARGAKVSEHDGSYQISGEAVPQDTKDTSAPKPFELKVKCP